MIFDVVTQILILSVGIYLLLAFLRSTRGSGLVRGLGLGLIVGVYGLWGISDAMEWFELKLVIQGFLGFIFVILAIVFQPECVSCRGRLLGRPGPKPCQCLTNRRFSAAAAGCIQSSTPCRCGASCRGLYAL